MVAPPDTIVTERSTVLFTCVAFGIPLPVSILWTAAWDNGSVVYLENSTYVNIEEEVVTAGGVGFLHSVLELCSVPLSFSGQYTCFAENSAGSDNSSFQLIVQPFGMYVHVCSVSTCTCMCSSRLISMRVGNGELYITCIYM